MAPGQARCQVIVTRSGWSIGGGEAIRIDRLTKKRLEIEDYA